MEPHPSAENWKTTRALAPEVKAFTHTEKPNTRLRVIRASLQQEYAEDEMVREPWIGDPANKLELVCPEGIFVLHNDMRIHSHIEGTVTLENAEKVNMERKTLEQAEKFMKQNTNLENLDESLENWRKNGNATMQIA